MHILQLSKDESKIVCPNPLCFYEHKATKKHFSKGTLMLLPCPKCQIVGVKPKVSPPNKIKYDPSETSKSVGVKPNMTRDETIDYISYISEIASKHATPTESIDDTLKARGSRYGKFRDNARISQALEEVLKSGANYQETNQVHREALKFICQKMSRIVNGDPDYVDNWHDITGYATLAEKECK